LRDSIKESNGIDEGPSGIRPFHLTQCVMALV